MVASSVEKNCFLIFLINFCIYNNSLASHTDLIVYPLPVWRMKIQEKDSQSSKKSSLGLFFLSSSFSLLPVSTFSSHFLLYQWSSNLNIYINVPTCHFLCGISFTCLLILARSLWQPRRANKMHRRMTETPRTHKKGKLEFEIMGSESLSLLILTQEVLLCSITAFQSNDRQRRY